MDIEALAAARAIELGTELGITHIVLEGDLGILLKLWQMRFFAWLTVPL